LTYISRDPIIEKNNKINKLFLMILSVPPLFSKGEYKKRRLQIHLWQLAENVVEVRKALELKSQS
jgi:hypothetical protein